MANIWVFLRRISTTKSC